MSETHNDREYTLEWKLRHAQARIEYLEKRLEGAPKSLGDYFGLTTGLAFIAGVLVGGFLI